MKAALACFTWKSVVKIRAGQKEGGGILEEEYAEGAKKEASVGEQIRYLRKKSGMTQEELGKELNVTRQALSNWERNVNTPDTDTLQRLSFLFGVHMDDFVRKAMHMESSDEKGDEGNMENGVEKKR